MHPDGDHAEEKQYVTDGHDGECYELRGAMAGTDIQSGGEKEAGNHEGEHDRRYVVSK